MASSRWKRFAFFDRKNLPLPPSVVKDLVPPELSGRSTDHDSSSIVLGKLYPEGSEKEATRIGIGEYFSLSCSDAVLPSKILEEGAVERNTAGDGVAGMLAGVMARVGGDGSSTSSSDEGSNALQLVFASSRNTSLAHCIDVTARCTPNNPQVKSDQRSGGRDAFHMQQEVNDEYNAEELDGWRGYYKPFLDGVVKKQSAAPAGGSTVKNAPPRPTSSRRSAEQRILDEHLSTSVDSSSASLFASSPFAEPDAPKARIVGLASCYDARNSVLFVASITDAHNTTGVIVHTNPHLRLRSSLPPQSEFVSSSVDSATEYSTYYRPSSEFNFKHGNPCCVSIKPGVCCVGTEKGVVLVYAFDCHNNSSSGVVSSSPGKMSMVAEIPAPRGGDTEINRSVYCVSSVELIAPEETGETTADYSNGIHRLFVSYRRRSTEQTEEITSSTPTGGVCCYDLGGLRIPGSKLTNIQSSINAPVVSARYDMDGRDVPTSCLCDAVSLPPSVFDEKENEKMLPRYSVARSDGLHLYSCTEKVGVCPVDGSKIGMCTLPPAPVVYLKRRQPRFGENDGDEPSKRRDSSTAGASYVLVATTDAKANRDAVDIYDTSNKLVGFHVLLSPGHRALRTVGMMSAPVVNNGVLVRGGRTSGVIFTSGGSIVTLTEKVTPEKVALLVTKQLYPAAISMAFSDPAFYRPEDITGLYRKYAESLYRKGDFSAAMDQYILTIGSLESSHVIFRYLDSPRIPLVVKYLEALRAKGLSSSVHDELLRTCYLKLNDHESASKISLSPSAVEDMAAPQLNPDGTERPTISISRNLLACADDPSELLAAICSLEAHEAVEALVAHGPMLARSLARETAGVVIALCDGTFSPTDLADAAAGRSTAEGRAIGTPCEKYPISLFANAFLENPKLFRLILSHCRRNDCVLSPMLRRTLLELTLDEWNVAKRTGDAEVEKLRYDEAISMLSESHADDMGDYEALVIVQAAGFLEGEILLYERLNMNHMLLQQYAVAGDERARRNMLSMCEHDPDLFAEVLAHFVRMAGERLYKDGYGDEVSVSSDSEVGGLLHDIHEALVLARDHGNAIAPVRVMRILAGEGHGQFSSGDSYRPELQNYRGNIPLSVAMDYVGATLDESGAKIQRLQNNVEEYSRLCTDLEMEIDALLSSGLRRKEDGGHRSLLPNIDIDEMYSNLCEQLSSDNVALSEITKPQQSSTDSKEAFWREMEHSDDPFETICYFLSRGHLEDI